MQKWVKDNEKPTFDYILGIDTNTTLYFDKQSEKRIGIVLREIPSGR